MNGVEFNARVQSILSPQDGVVLVDHPLESSLARSQARGLDANLRDQFQFLGGPPLLELQALRVQTPRGGFDRSRAAHALDADALVTLAAEADAWQAHGIYLLTARLKPGVETRHASPGRWFDLPKQGGTTDSDVAARLVLAIDFDVQRPTGTSATDDELRLSINLSLKAWDILSERLGVESMAYLHSGNGRQIHIALDSIAVTDESKNMCSAILSGLDAMFSTSEVRVDRKLYDPKRILPACGTVKKKGAPGIEDRPHRRTAIVVPESVKRLSLEDLKVFARWLWEESDDARRAMGDVLGIRRPRVSTPATPLQPKQDSPFARANAVDAREVAEWLGIVDYQGVITCPGCGETKGADAIDHGFKCFHNRCQGKGKNGFRTNIDLVMEVKHLNIQEATLAICEKFGLPTPVFSTSQQQTVEDRPQRLQTLSDIIPRATEMARRRAEGIERPIPIPWSSLVSHYGGGFWPGVHFLCSGTGIGKTQAALQVAMNSARANYPVGYVGLELEPSQIGLRSIGEHGGIPWSALYTGQATPRHLELMDAHASDLLSKNLPLHPVFSRPQGWPASELTRLADSMRELYPEPNGPGSRPMLVVVDFLQLVGEEITDKRPLDLRERVGRAAYAMRDVASRLGIVVLVISSIARDKYMVLGTVASAAGLRAEADESGRPIYRRVMNPDALVGLGKESGDIEFSGDSVSVISRVPDIDGAVLWTTAKGRATGATWSPLVFDGYRFDEPLDGGAEVFAAMKSKREERETERKKEESAKVELERAKAEAKEQGVIRDAIAVVRYVLDVPSAGVRDLRGAAGGQRRWDAVRDYLGPSLVASEPTKGGKATFTVYINRVPKVVADGINICANDQEN